MAIRVRVDFWCEGCQAKAPVDVELEGHPRKMRINLETVDNLPTGWKLRSRTFPDSRKKKVKPELSVWCERCLQKGKDVG